MNFHLFSLFLINTYLSALLCFFFSWGIVELCLSIFRVQHARSCFLFRLLPFFKLPIDLWNCNLSQWFRINCSERILDLPLNSRFLTVELGWNMGPFFRVNLHDIQGNAFTPFDVVQEMTFPFLFDLIALIFIGAFSIRLLYFLGKILYSQRRAATYVKQARFCSKKIVSPLLKKHLLRKRIQILESDHSGFSPFASGIFHPKIVFPKHLICLLDQEEYEAILAHELQHLKGYDSILFLYVRLVITCMVIIPFSHLYLRKLYWNCENAADQSCYVYGLSPMKMAQALHQTAKYLLLPPIYTTAQLESDQGILKKRISSLLTDSWIKLTKTKEVLYIVFFLGLMIFLFKSYLFKI